MEVKGRSKANSKTGKLNNSCGKMQTISSMFQKAAARHTSAKCDSLKNQLEQSSSDIEDDVMIVEVQETSSSYFNSKKLDIKRPAVYEDFKSKKRKKLSLIRCKKSHDGNTSVSNQSFEESAISAGETTCSPEETSTGYHRHNDAQQKKNSNLFADSLTVEMQLEEEDVSRAQALQGHNRRNSLANAKEKESSSRTQFYTDNQTKKTVHNQNFVPATSRCDDNLKNEAADICQTPTACSTVFNCETKAENLTELVNDCIGKEGTELKDEASEENLQISEPYYFKNFETILSSVLTDESNSQLFNHEDKTIINKYNSLTDGAKKLYIRMFCRKLKWIPKAKLNYPEIGSDLQPALDELVEYSFINNESGLTNLQAVLEVLSASDVKTLAKIYHVPPNLTQKSQQVDELMKMTQRTSISHLFGSGGGHKGLAQAMMTRAKKFLSGVYKLSELPRAVLVRVMMLFSVVDTSLDEDNGTGGQGQLFQMLMVNMGKVVYPEYQVDKTHSIFGSREDVIRFSQALQLEFDLLQATERGRWEEAYTIFLDVKERHRILEADENIVRWNKKLPDFLRSFTATSVVYRLLSQGIEILQRKKDFTAAVTLLNTLLDQKDYCCSYRGYWWERLALNLDTHLKNHQQSLEAVLSGLADPHVRVGHRLALYLRGKSICERPHLKLSHRLVECSHPPVRDLPKVHLEGRVLHNLTGSGPKFLTQASYKREENGEGVGDLAVCGVEEFVLDYYKTNGFPSGMHAEGSIVSSLFALFCWDILFLPVADAFHSPYQAMPLDLYTDHFYERRKAEIDKHIEMLATSSVEQLKTVAEKTWTNHVGVTCVGLNWERMRSVDCIKELVGCMGAHVLSGLLRRYAQSPRHTRSGFPDLTLWNPETGAFKICEVKGPGDRLSHKQILWIDYLLGLGVDAEVCHVK
ncbi:fanconi-associated nuclease 1, partial [Plakobranchus ocellatus]